MRLQRDAGTTSIFRRTTSRLHFDEIPTSKQRRVPAGMAAKLRNYPVRVAILNCNI